jgi:hypothetical protein
MRLMLSGRALLASAIVLLGFVGSARADFQYTTTPPIAFGPLGGGGTTTVSLPSFNSLLGGPIPAGATLTGVIINLTDSLTATVRVVNIDTNPHTFVNGSASFMLGLTDGVNPPLNATVTATVASGTANPGTNTYNPSTVTGSSSSPEITSGLAIYNTGPTVTLNASVSGGSFSGTETSGSGDLFFGGSGSVSGAVTLTYFYTVVPEPSSMILLGVGGVVGIFGRRAIRRRGV